MTLAGCRGVLCEAEIRDEGGVERGLGRRAGGGEIVDRLTSVLVPANKYSPLTLVLRIEVSCCMAALPADV